MATRIARGSFGDSRPLAAAHPVSYPADEPVEHVIGAATISVTSTVAPWTEDPEVTREFVAVALVGEVVNVEVRRCPAVHAAPSGTYERILAARLPLRASEVGTVLGLTCRPLLFLHD